MSLKHNANQSELLKAFESAAIEKGLIKCEIKKEAAKKELDLTPSDNLTINLLKLCSGLRKVGLNKYAEELENKFVNYKKAGGDLYDVSKETGEDLINSAHPDGSHEIKDIEGDSIVETILDQHLKDLKVVEKKPTGKLSNANDIIGAVKNIFKYGQERDINEVIKVRKEYIIFCFNKWGTIKKFATAKNIFDLINWSWDTIGSKQFISKNINELEGGLNSIKAPDTISKDSLNDIITDCADILRDSDKEITGITPAESSLDEANLNRFVSNIKAIQNEAYTALTILQGGKDADIAKNWASRWQQTLSEEDQQSQQQKEKQIQQQKEQQEEEKLYLHKPKNIELLRKTQNITARINDLNSKLNMYYDDNPKKLKDGQRQLSEAVKALTVVTKEIGNQGDNPSEDIISAINNRIEEITSFLNDFNNLWFIRRG